MSNQYFIINVPIYDRTWDFCHNRITIINRSNGLVEASFKIHEYFVDQMQFYLDKFLIAFDNETCLLKCYNFKGDLLHEITLDEKFEGSFISVINKELCFDLENNKILIF